MLQPAKQRSAGDSGQAQVPVEFLVAFVRALINNRPSNDLLALSMGSARARVPITDDQAKAFWNAVLYDVERAPWPKGFF